MGAKWIGIVRSPPVERNSAICAGKRTELS
jgi:hypothetical protein